MFAATSGYRNDGDGGLMQVGARYYDPKVGCFVTRDTYLDQKPYLYCEHNPINSLDPSGHDMGHHYREELKKPVPGGPDEIAKSAGEDLMALSVILTPWFPEVGVPIGVGGAIIFEIGKYPPNLPVEVFPVPEMPGIAGAPPPFFPH